MFLSCLYRRSRRAVSRKPATSQGRQARRARFESLESRIVFQGANDSMAGATFLGDMSSERTNFADLYMHGSDDVDLYSFTVAAGQTVKFDVDAGPTPVYNVVADTYLRLFNSSGTVIDLNDNGSAAGEGSTVNSYLEHTFSTAGTYYIGVSVKPNVSYNPLNGAGRVASNYADFYSLTVTPSAPPTDPDDAMNESANNNLGALGSYADRSFVIDSATDVDMYRFTATAGQSFNFSTIYGDSNFDSYLRLFDSTGKQLAANDTAEQSFAGAKFAELEYTFYTAGTYYIGVSASGNSGYNPLTGNSDTAGNSTGSRHLTILNIDNRADTNDQIGENATLLGGPKRYSVGTGELSNTTDVDMWSFKVKKGQKVGFDIDRPAGGTLDTYLRVFQGSTGKELAHDDDGDKRTAPGETGSRESYLTYKFKKKGTYFVAVSAFPNIFYDPITGGRDDNGRPYAAAVGEYDLVITKLGGGAAKKASSSYLVAVDMPVDDGQFEFSSSTQEVRRVAETEWAGLSGEILTSQVDSEALPVILAKGSSSDGKGARNRNAERIDWALAELSEHEAIEQLAAEAVSDVVARRARR